MSETAERGAYKSILLSWIENKNNVLWIEWNIWQLLVAVNLGSEGEWFNFMKLVWNQVRMLPTCSCRRMPRHCSHHRQQA